MTARGVVLLSTASASNAANVAFPDGFVWGAGTSAFQIEGALTAGGRGPSIWDDFSARPGAVFDGNTGEPACDSYRRWADDVALLGDAGLNAYRFSFSWPRILPAGTGAMNAEGIEFYRAAMEALLAVGVEPWPTLYHWDLPAALQAKGGWENRDIVSWFGEYVEVIAEQLGDLFGNCWILNEPNYHALLGFRLGTNAPGIKSEKAFLSAMHHQNVVQREAARALRGLVPAMKVGTVITLQHCRPSGDNPGDHAAAERLDAMVNRAFLDPALLGRYPVAIETALDEHGLLTPADRESMRADLDFLGVNFYGPFYAATNGATGLEIAPTPLGVPVTPIGLPDQPEDLRAVLDELRKDYGNPVVYISEIGTGEWVGGADGMIDDQVVQVDDQHRIEFYRRHFAEVATAIADGSNCRGIFVWSLLDNLEWEYGWAVRFGLVKVDSRTQQRTPKASYRWYAKVAEANAIVS